MEMIENGMIVNQEKYDKQAEPEGLYACPNCGAPLYGDDTLYMVSGNVTCCEKCTAPISVWEAFVS